MGVWFWSSTPQVPVEYGWNEEEFLNHTCEKAGAPFDHWKQKSTAVLRFEVIVLKETEPKRPAVRDRTIVSSLLLHQL